MRWPPEVPEYEEIPTGRTKVYDFPNGYRVECVEIRTGWTWWRVVTTRYGKPTCLVFNERVSCPTGRESHATYEGMMETVDFVRRLASEEP
jgi:hypothetical protein